MSKPSVLRLTVYRGQDSITVKADDGVRILREFTTLEDYFDVAETQAYMSRIVDRFLRLAVEED